jgi:hypothetical protein
VFDETSEGIIRTLDKHRLHRSDQSMAPRGSTGVHGTWNCHTRASRFNGQSGGDHRSGACCCLHNKCRSTEPSENTVATRESIGGRRRIDWALADDRPAARNDLVEKVTVFRWIGFCQTATDHRNRPSLCPQRTAVRLAINSARGTRHNRNLSRRECRCKAPRLLDAVRRRAPRSHNGNGPRIAPLQSAADQQCHWRIRRCCEHRWIVVILDEHQSGTERTHLLSLPIWIAPPHPLAHCRHSHRFTSVEIPHNRLEIRIACVQQPSECAHTSALVDRLTPRSRGAIQRLHNTKHF